MKILKGIGYALLILCIGAVFANLFHRSKGCLPQEKPVEELPLVTNETLNEQLQDAGEETYYRLNGSYELTQDAGAVTLLGGEDAGAMVLSGDDGASITVTGKGKGTVQAANGGSLTFKNVTFYDETTDGGSAWYNYLWLGGSLTFENCTFTDSIYLEDDAQATFVNCSFHSPQAKQYAVWVADGSASFTGCKFTGTRGLKIHEFTGGDDVVNVYVDTCEFLELSEKPGVVIGDVIVEPLKTTVSIKNSRFIKCYKWDYVGSLEGSDSYYESDTLTTEFNFVTENNTVEVDEELNWTSFY